MNREYADNKEIEDYERFKDFASKLNLKDYGQTPHFSCADVSGVTNDGKVLIIELKHRNQSLLDNELKLSGTTKTHTYTADTIYIETHKVGSLLLDYVTDEKIPIYINFLKDDTVVVYNLLKLKRRPQTVTKKIYSNLYQAIELSKREELPLSEAWIYRKENNVWNLKHKP